MPTYIPITPPYPPAGNYGDITFTGGAGATINTNAVTNADLAQAPANTVKGNLTSATANVTDVTVAALSQAITYPITDLTTDLFLREQLAGAMLSNQDFAQLAVELQKGSSYGYPG